MGGATKKLKHSMPVRASHEVPRATESGVFVTSPRAIDVMPIDSSHVLHDLRGAIEEVTLIVYGWENVQPGTLSWVFPSLRSALAAVRAMRNAVRWAVLNGVTNDGDDDQDVELARENGRVLVEAS
jgi:hypothetical protein